MMTNAERLAMALIVEPMTINEIAVFLDDVSVEYAKQVVTTMRRKVLPELGAWCPRPTHGDGFVYVVLDSTPDADEMKLCIAGANAMHKDNRRRLLSMLQTAVPYRDALDLRTVEGKRADLYVKTAQAGLAALELME